MNYKKNIILLILAFSMGVFIFSKSFAKVKIESPMQLHSVMQTCPKIYKAGISGTDYGWNILTAVIIFTHPSLELAEKAIWENSGIPESKRHKYYLVNIRQQEGMAWNTLLVGQAYLTVIADIAKK